MQYQQLTTELCSNTYKKNDDSSINDEILFFKRLHEHSVTFVVEDDSMLPFYKPGDHVAGIKCDEADIKKIIGMDCIALTKTNQMVLRNLQAGPRENSYNLVCANFQSSIKDKILYDVQVISIAPVIWIRRRSSI